MIGWGLGRTLWIGTRHGRVWQTGGGDVVDHRRPFWYLATQTLLHLHESQHKHQRFSITIKMNQGQSAICRQG